MNESIDSTTDGELHTDEVSRTDNPTGDHEQRRTPGVRRRQVLQGLATAGLAGLAGCQSALGGSDNTELSPPENYDNLQETDLPYPIHGEELPAVEVPTVLAGETVSTRQFVGERHVLLTFVYTRCGSICPALTSNLVRVQADAANESYGDRIALLATTFDPAYDTPDRLRSFGEKRGANVDAANWYFLRPESEARVETVVVETFGHEFSENPGEGMPFLHNPLLLLANDKGYVERAYTNEVPDPATVRDDVRSLVE
jgi:protein SCO1/2